MRLPLARQTPPPPLQKSPDELKAILHSITAKAGAEREVRKVQSQQSLKGALAAVLAKNGALAALTPPPAPMQTPAAAEPPRSRAPTATSPPTPLVSAKQPFEVPEEALRKVLKGDT